MKTYIVSVSGSYFTQTGELIDFEYEDKIIPYNKDVGLAESAIRKRFAPMWVMLDENSKRVKTVRVVHIDDMRIGEQHRFGFEGKDIREMTMEDLQYLAAAANLREIQLFRKSDLRSTRTTAYYAYSEHVLGQKIKEPMDLFNIMDAPPLLVKGAVKAATLPEMDAQTALDNIPEEVII